MTSLDQRENAFGAEFAHREELKFRVRECAAASLARWAAQRLGQASVAGEAYAREMVAADVAGPKRDAAIERITADLRPAGVRPQEVRQAVEQFLAQAEALLHASARVMLAPTGLSCSANT